VPHSFVRSARAARRFAATAFASALIATAGAAGAAPAGVTAADDAARLNAEIAAHPADRDALRSLADLDVRTGDDAGAEILYRRLEVLAPGDKTTHDRLGNLFAKEDRVDEAISEFEKALPDVAAFTDLVRLHRRAGDLAAFVAEYRQRAESSPLDMLAQFGYGVILRELRQPDRALPYLLAALRAEPRSCPALTEVGNAQLDLGETAEATDSFRRCLGIDPNDYGALVDLSDALGADRIEARTLLDRAVAARPNRPEAFVDLGYLEDAAGKTDAAVARFEHALDLDPFCRDAYVDLGFAYFEEGKYGLADATLLRGLGVSRDDGRLEFILGKSFARQGKAELARREYRDAAHSDEPEIAAAATRELAVAP
jgi:tetratricopeptide (TPR) repeat protein